MIYRHCTVSIFLLLYKYTIANDVYFNIYHSFDFYYAFLFFHISHFDQIQLILLIFHILTHEPRVYS